MISDHKKIHKYANCNLSISCTILPHKHVFLAEKDRERFIQLWDWDVENQLKRIIPSHFVNELRSPLMKIKSLHFYL